MNNVFDKTDEIEMETPRFTIKSYLNLNLNLLNKQHFYIWKENNNKKNHNNNNDEELWLVQFYK